MAEHIAVPSNGHQQIQYSDDPEVVVDTSPQPIYSDLRPEEKIVVPLSHQTPGSVVVPASIDRSSLHEKQLTVHDEPGVVPGSENSQKGPWWKRKRILGIVLIALLAIIALATGLGVGLSKKSKDKDPPFTGQNLTTAIACNSTLCPQVLSVAELNDKYYIFGRNTDGIITYRVGWDESDTTWTTLDESRNVLSQPAAISWKPESQSPRLDVMAVTGQGNVRGTHLTDAGWSIWEDMNLTANSQPVLCTTTENRTDLWLNDNWTHNLTHTYWVTSDKKWKDTAGNSGLIGAGPAKGAPAVACRSLRNSSVLHDIVWYDRDKQRVWHTSYIRSNSTWTTWGGFGGIFLGDPVLINYSELLDRIDFFGIQEDRHMYHFSKQDEGTYSEMEDIGGSFASVPSVISPTTGVYDVIGLGMDGDLYHNRYNGSWWNSWENLGIQSNSAPAAFQAGDTQAFFYLTETGELMSSAGTPDGDGSWKGFVTVSIGGGTKLTNNFFISDGGKSIAEKHHPV